LFGRVAEDAGGADDEGLAGEAHCRHEGCGELGIEIGVSAPTFSGDLDANDVEPAMRHVAQEVLRDPGAAHVARAKHFDEALAVVTSQVVGNEPVAAAEGAALLAGGHGVCLVLPHEPAN